MTKGVRTGKDAAVSGAQGAASEGSVWSGSARRKQRDHGAAVCLEQGGGRGGCGGFGETVQTVRLFRNDPGGTVCVLTR